MKLVLGPFVRNVKSDRKEDRQIEKEKRHSPWSRINENLKCQIGGRRPCQPHRKNDGHYLP